MMFFGQQNLPFVRLGKTKDTKLSVRQILLQPYLTVIDPQASAERQWHIAGFTTVVDRKDEDSQVNDKSEFQKLSAKQLALIQLLKPGDTIFFDNIRGEMSDGRLTKLPSFTVVIR
jgi:hypothetical protein